MSRKQTKSKVEPQAFDTEFSSGDSNKMTQKPKQLYKEENNNEIDEVSKDFTEMGCIVDAVKRPANVCVETCVYEDSGSETEDCQSQIQGDGNEEDAYSDAFEEGSDEENGQDEKYENESNEESLENNELRAVQSEENNGIAPGLSNLKLSKSQSFVSSKVSRSGTSFSKYGSIPVPTTRRINMSFTNDRLRDIERHNHILLDKILSARNSRKSSIPPRQAEPNKPMAVGPAPAAMHRKKQQRQIDRDNMILLRKIQQAKSSSCSFRR